MAGFRLGAFSFLFAVIGTVCSAALTFDSIVNKPNSVLALGGILCIVYLSGCSTIPEMPNAISCSGGTRVVSGFEKCVYLPREIPEQSEAKYREDAGEPNWSKEERVLGIALSGGGSKSAPFAMGVLAGLHDIGLLLPNVDDNAPKQVIVSSVSGGGYAAYHLFAHLAWSKAHNDRFRAHFLMTYTRTV